MARSSRACPAASPVAPNRTAEDNTSAKHTWVGWLRRYDSSSKGCRAPSPRLAGSGGYWHCRQALLQRARGRELHLPLAQRQLIGDLAYGQVLHVAKGEHVVGAGFQGTKGYRRAGVGSRCSGGAAAATQAPAPRGCCPRPREGGSQLGSAELNALIQDIQGFMDLFPEMRGAAATPCHNLYRPVRYWLPVRKPRCGDQDCPEALAVH